MRVEPRDDQVTVWMTRAEADDLLRELDKWPDLPKVERDLVEALKAFRNPSSDRPNP
jgi:hypothetical protein